MPPTSSILIGRSLSGLTAERAWLKRYLALGLLLLVPVVGSLVVLGWQRRVYERAREGDDQGLPPIDLGADLGHGVPVIVAMMNLVVPAMVVMVLGWLFLAGVAAVGAGLEQTTGSAGAGGVLGAVGVLGFYGAFLVAWLGAMVAMPELQRRGFNGEMMPLLSPGESLRAVRSEPRAYLAVLLGTLVASLVGALGALACYPGMILTVPMSVVILARLVAQWDKLVEERLYGG